MPRDALVDGHRRRAIGINLRILRAQEAQTICRRASRHICLERCALQVRIRRGGHTQHRIAFGHARRHIEREPLEIRDTLRRNALRLAHDERVVCDDALRRPCRAAVKLCPAEIGRTRDLDDVAACNRRRVRRPVGQRTSAVDRALIAPAANVDHIALGGGDCRIAARVGICIAAADSPLEVARRQRQDISVCGYGRLGCCACFCRAAADLFPYCACGAERDAVRICRRKDRVRTVQNGCRAANDAAPIRIGTARDGDNILICRRGCARA